MTLVSNLTYDIFEGVIKGCSLPIIKILWSMEMEQLHCVQTWSSEWLTRSKYVAFLNFSWYKSTSRAQQHSIMKICWKQLWPSWFSNIYPTSSPFHDSWVIEVHLLSQKRQGSPNIINIRTFKNFNNSSKISWEFFRILDIRVSFHLLPSHKKFPPGAQRSLKDWDLQEFKAFFKEFRIYIYGSFFLKLFSCSFCHFVHHTVATHQEKLSWSAISFLRGFTDLRFSASRFDCERLLWGGWKRICMRRASQDGVHQHCPTHVSTQFSNGKHKRIDGIALMFITHTVLACFDIWRLCMKDKCQLSGIAKNRGEKLA